MQMYFLVLGKITPSKPKTQVPIRHCSRWWEKAVASWLEEDRSLGWMAGWKQGIGPGGLPGTQVCFLASPRGWDRVRAKAIYMLLKYSTRRQTSHQGTEGRKKERQDFCSSWNPKKITFILGWNQGELLTLWLEEHTDTQTHTFSLPLPPPTLSC